jgi:hypothetical protein
MITIIISGFELALLIHFRYLFYEPFKKEKISKGKISLH